MNTPPPDCVERSGNAGVGGPRRHVVERRAGGAGVAPGPAAAARHQGRVLRLPHARRRHLWQVQRARVRNLSLHTVYLRGTDGALEAQQIYR